MHIPVNPDFWSNLGFVGVNPPPWSNTLGLLDVNGQAAASFSLPPAR
jgi:hypothetical protein